ncbi:hypothetical protein WJX72_007979 [[Myrmecia] bisecta]|uniref:RING-type domain-containing protein n=1 Tax=[Myrmecia] bisecta TaxID=41462 RepID=A0AAW1QRN6_9CHLO
MENAVNLCSPDKDDVVVTHVERPRKRPRQPEVGQVSTVASGGVIDLSADSPTAPRSKLMLAPERGQQPSSSAGLWGELDSASAEEAHPRWRQLGRRTVRAARIGGVSEPVPAQHGTPEAMSVPAWRHSRSAASSSGAQAPIGRFGSMGLTAPRRAPSAITAGGCDVSASRQESRHQPATRVHSNTSLADACGCAGLHSEADLDDELLARRLQSEEDRAAGRRVAADADLMRRMDELEALELANVEAPGWQPWRAGRGPAQPPRPPTSRARGASRRRGWGASSLAEAVMLGVLGGGMPFPAVGGAGAAGRASHLSTHLSAMRHAYASMSGSLRNSRLPPQLLFSDRDFNENDYEALLALDEGIENRKGASEAAIERIPVTVLAADGLGEDEDNKCSICLDELVMGSVLRRLPCGHQFHRTCLDKWLLQKATCPICQAHISA